MLCRCLQRPTNLWLLRQCLTLLVLALVQATSLGNGWPVGECVGCSRLGPIHDGCCPTGAVCQSCCQCDAYWTVTADWLWMGRNRADQQALYFADVNGTLFNVLDAGDLTFDINGGLRTEISRKLASGRRFELSYFGAIDQTARQTLSVDPAIPNLNSVTFRFFGAAGGNATSYQADYQSDLHNAEANLQFGCCYGFEPLVGFRWMYLGERLDLFEVPTPTTGALGELRNNLVGAQIGARKDLWGYGRWLRSELVLKTGILHNSIEMHGDIHTAAGPNMAIDRSFSTASAVGEIQLTAVWQPWPNVRFRAGYTGVWLNDVAFVADQLDNFNIATGQGNLEKAHARFHGGHVGFEFDW